MPYGKFKRGNKWKVYKVRSDETPYGPAVGVHDTEEQADKQLTALKINVEELISEVLSMGDTNTIGESKPQQATEESLVTNESKPVGEFGYDMGFPGSVEMNYSIQSFADFDAAESAADMRKRLAKRMDQYFTLFWRIWNDEAIEFSEKPNRWEMLSSEFLDVFRNESEIMREMERFSEGPAVVELSECSPVKFVQFGGENETASLSESSEGSNDNRSPLYMNVEIIQPGWGNKRDGHYYRPEMLREYADKFKGVKMYVTNHNESERSERTEVSEIEDLIGFSERGAPIMKVAVFDPDFAEKTRNRAAMGKLETLECSVLAEGTASLGTVDGRRAKIVETISTVHAVDWVTRAGAGGRAVSLSESFEEVQMEKDSKNTTVSEGSVTAPAPVSTPAPTPTVTASGGNAANVSIRENAEGNVATGDTANTANSTPDNAALAESSESSTPENVQIAYLSESEVNEVLGEVKLPKATRERVMSNRFANRTALIEFVNSELAYIEELTGAGSPNSGRAESVKPTDGELRTPAQIRESQDAVNDKWGF